jgi:hypothetical protein
MLLRAWASRAYPGVPLSEQFRLGPTISHLVGVTVTPALEAALRVNNWYADAVLMLPFETLIVEAKVKPTPSAVSQVKFYADLLPRTPEMQNRLSLPINCTVLFAEDDPSVTSFAQRHGCRVAIYTPPWIADYLQLVQFRTRATSPPKAPAEPSEGESSPGA